MVQRRSKAVGFGGEYLIHPAQIVPVHRVFSPV
jgi:citrate lyase beta subunit